MPGTGLPGTGFYGGGVSEGTRTPDRLDHKRVAGPSEVVSNYNGVIHLINAVLIPSAG
jgi:hypothetical protein